MNCCFNHIKFAESCFKDESFSMLKVKMCLSINLVFLVCALSVYIHQSCASLGSHVETESAEQPLLVCRHLHCVSSFLSLHIYTFHVPYT